MNAFHTCNRSTCPLELLCALCGDQRLCSDVMTASSNKNQAAGKYILVTHVRPFSKSMCSQANAEEQKWLYVKELLKHLTWFVIPPYLHIQQISGNSWVWINALLLSITRRPLLFIFLLKDTPAQEQSWASLHFPYMHYFVFLCNHEVGQSV